MQLAVESGIEACKPFRTIASLFLVIITGQTPLTT